MLGWAFAVMCVVLVVVMVRAAKANADRLHLRELLRKKSSQFDDAVARISRCQQKAETLSTAIDQLRHGVMLLSPAGKILTINPAATYLLNLDSLPQWKNRPLIEVIRLPELNRSVSAVREQLQQGESEVAPRKLSIQVPYVGKTQSVKVRLSTFESNHRQRILVSLQDETDAILLDEMRREFVANTSHELKTPLAAIKGYAETVQLAIDDDPGAAKHFISQIDVQCQRLERLIADMMQLARAQSADFMHTLSEVSVASVIDQAVTANLPIAEGKKITLVNQGVSGSSPGSAPKSATVYGDPDAVLTIVNNLVSNAVRYTKSGGQVFVGVSDHQKHCGIHVRDTGVGIAPGDQKRVFERFFRVQKNRNLSQRDDETGINAPPGTGIGLSIVKQLTKALGGEVVLRSTPGVGSEFVVRLPKPPGSSEPAEQDKPSVAIASGLTRPTTGKAST